jgi:hypothetical protein
VNIYGGQARRHWQEWLPEQYEAIENPANFFAELGLWISDEVARIEFELLPPDYYSDEDFMTRVGHRGMARLRAEEIVLRHAMPAPEPTDVDSELPATWDAIFEASVIDADDVVLPRCSPH